MCCDVLSFHCRAGVVKYVDPKGKERLCETVELETVHSEHTPIDAVDLISTYTLARSVMCMCDHILLTVPHSCDTQVIQAGQEDQFSGSVPTTSEQVAVVIRDISIMAEF